MSGGARRIAAAICVSAIDVPGAVIVDAVVAHLRRGSAGTGRVAAAVRVGAIDVAVAVVVNSVVANFRRGGATNGVKEGRHLVKVERKRSVNRGVGYRVAWLTNVKATSSAELTNHFAG